MVGLSAEQITAGQERLVGYINGTNSGTLSVSDRDQLLQSFRLLVGPLETENNYQFELDLVNVNDADGRLRAAKLAAYLVLLIDQDFDVDQLDSTIKSNGYDQRRLFAIAAFSILYKIPAELMEDDIFNKILRLNRRYSVSAKTKFIAN